MKDRVRIWMPLTGRRVTKERRRRRRRWWWWWGRKGVGVDAIYSRQHGRRDAEERVDGGLGGLDDVLGQTWSK